MIVNANANDVSGTHLDLLWSSGSVGSSMNNEIVAINTLGYEVICIQFIVVSGTSMCCSEMIPVESSIDYTILATHSHNKTLYSRGFTITADGIEFAMSSEKNLSNNEVFWPTSIHMVPYRIYGMR